MTIALARICDGKKFMWDGAEYASEEQARQAGETYQKEGFEVQVFKETDTFLVYSRRVAAKQTQS